MGSMASMAPPLNLHLDLFVCGKALPRREVDLQEPQYVAAKVLEVSQEIFRYRDRERERWIGLELELDLDLHLDQIR